MVGWKNIWISRSAPSTIDLATALSLSGFDQGLGVETEETWSSYVKNVVTRVNIAVGSDVIEYGCGAGAFLYMLHDLKACNVTGVDYSPSLVAFAKQLVPGHYTTQDILDFEPNKIYDVSFSNSVFQYLSLTSAKQMLLKMEKSTSYAFVILDIPDLAKKEEAQAARRNAENKAECGESEDNTLRHTYYERRFFQDFADKNDLKLQIIQNSHISDSLQGNYRFTAIFKR